MENIQLSSLLLYELLTSVPDEKVVEVVVGVRVLGLQGEHRGVGGSVQLHHRLQQVIVQSQTSAAMQAV